MDFTIHHVYDHSGLPWMSLLGPALQVVLGGIAAVWLARYKAQLDTQAETQKADQERIAGEHQGEIDRMLQAHKKEMNKQEALFDAQIAKQMRDYESKFRQFEYEHQTKFADLHKRRADVIVEMHRLLVEIKDYLDELISTETKERVEGVNTPLTERLINFMRYHRGNRLYFSSALDRQLSSVVSLVSRTRTSHKLSVRFAYHVEHSDRWSDKALETATALEEALKLTECEFRKLLGTEAD